MKYMYLHGVCDARSRLLFKFRSGTHKLNEELVGIEGGKPVRWNALYVEMSVRM